MKRPLCLIIAAVVLFGLAFFGHYGWLDNKKFQKEYLDNIEKANGAEAGGQFNEAALAYEKARIYLKERKYYKDDNNKAMDNLSILIGNSYYNEAEKQLKDFLEFKPNQKLSSLGEIVKNYQQALEKYGEITEKDWLVKFNEADATIMVLAIKKFLNEDSKDLESKYASALNLLKEARLEYNCANDDVCARNIIWNIEMLIKPSPPRTNEPPQGGKGGEGDEKSEKKEASKEQILEGLGDLLAALKGQDKEMQIQMGGFGLKGGLSGQKKIQPSKNQPGATARGERPLGIK